MRRVLDLVKADIDATRAQFMDARVPELMRDAELTREQAEAEAAEEWGPQLQAQAPNCWSCEFIGPIQHDPYATGDSPDWRECTLFSCPWGKN